MANNLIMKCEDSGIFKNYFDKAPSEYHLTQND